MRNRNELTNKEKAILTMLADGDDYREIALKLHITVNTVQSRMVYIMFKLDANNRTHAVANALRSRMIDTEKQEQCT